MFIIHIQSQYLPFFIKIAQNFVVLGNSRFTGFVCDRHRKNSIQSITISFVFDQIAQNFAVLGNSRFTGFVCDSHRKNLLRGREVTYIFFDSEAEKGVRDVGHKGEERRGKTRSPPTNNQRERLGHTKTKRDLERGGAKQQQTQKEEKHTEKGKRSVRGGEEEAVRETAGRQRKRRKGDQLERKTEEN